jgi:UDP-glucose:(heptosyl)LPS alpha-1,3-glucosyltransferase
MKYYSVPSDDIAVIHNGVNLEEFSPEKKADARPKVRAKLGLDEGAILAIFSGWEFKRKGLMQLVMAMPNIDGLHVMAVGGDEPEPYVRQAKLLGVGDRLHFTGPVSDMSNYYAASDLLIFPTAYEPFGLVITEAMASGIPVVTSRLAGAAEIITDGMDGMLLDNPKSPEEIAMKTNHMLDRGILGKMGAAARRTALRYSWDHVAKMTLAIYEQAMD